MFNNQFQGHNSSGNPPAPFQPGYSLGQRLDAVGYDGGAGENTYIFSGNSGDYTINGSGPGFTVSGGEGEDIFQNVNFLQFADTLVAAPCYLEGTRILTPEGEVPVEGLRAGDLVLVQRGAERRAEPVAWVGHRRVPLAAMQEMLRAVLGIDEFESDEEAKDKVARLRELGLGPADMAAVSTVLGLASDTGEGVASPAQSLRPALGRMALKLAEDRLTVFAWDGAESMDDESAALRKSSGAVKELVDAMASIRASA